MERQRTMNKANGILSGIILASGIAITGFFGTYVLILFVNNADPKARKPVYSAHGFAGIIPGIFGIIATVRKQQGWYIAQLVLMIISLAAMAYGLYEVIYLIRLFGGLHFFDCRGDFCENFKALTGMLITLTIVYICACCATLAAAIISGILGSASCRQIPDNAGQPWMPFAVSQMRAPNHQNVVPLEYMASQPAFGPNAGEAAFLPIISPSTKSTRSKRPAE